MRTDWIAEFYLMLCGDVNERSIQGRGEYMYTCDRFTSLYSRN